MSEIGIKVLEERITYNGTQIIPGWASENFGMVGDSVIAFRGPMRVSKNEMLDIGDIEREGALGDILISSDDALHFIIEHHDHLDMKVAYLRERILIFILAEVLRGYTMYEITRDHSDLYLGKKKLTVSIASISKKSMKIHLGVNVQSSGVPDYVKAVGLQELGISDDKILEIASEICERYKSEILKIETDIIKTKRL